MKIVCFFCDRDETAAGVKWVRAVGKEGICNECAAKLREAIDNDAVEVS